MEKDMLNIIFEARLEVIAHTTQKDAEFLHSNCHPTEIYDNLEAIIHKSCGKDSDHILQTLNDFIEDLNVDFENMEIHIVQGLVREFEFDEEKKVAHATNLKLSKLKTESSLRTIPLTSYLASVLMNYKKNQRRYMKRLGDNITVLTDLVFTNDSGDYLEESNARKKVCLTSSKSRHTIYKVSCTSTYICISYFRSQRASKSCPRIIRSQ